MSSLDPLDFTFLLLAAFFIASVIALYATYKKDNPGKKGEKGIVKSMLSFIDIFTGNHAGEKREPKEPIELAKEQIKQEKFEQAVLTLTEYLNDHPLDKEAHQLLEHAVKWS